MCSLWLRRAMQSRNYKLQMGNDGNERKGRNTVKGSFFFVRSLKNVENVWYKFFFWPLYSVSIHTWNHPKLVGSSGAQGTVLVGYLAVDAPCANVTKNRLTVWRFVTLFPFNEPFSALKEGKLLTTVWNVKYHQFFGGFLFEWCKPKKEF